MADLVEITVKSAFRKFGCVVLHPALERMPTETREGHRISAYSLAGRACAADVSEWARAEGFYKPIEYVFEDGDKGRGKLMERLETDGFPLPIFRPKCDTVKNGLPVYGFIPLQAADIYAYELRVRITKLHIDRRSYKALDAIPGGARAFNESAIAVFSAGLVPPAEHLIVIPGSGS